MFKALELAKSELDEYFVFKCATGIQQRNLHTKPEYIERLDYEMGVILSMGFPGYFLIKQDVLNWARSQGIMVGPGRGSAAGSLVAYCLKITNLDPIKWDLLFERFLNPSRISMPDIDSDIAKHERDRVIEYIVNKFGKDKVAHISTFGTSRAKAAVRTIARTLGHPYQVGDDLANLLLAPVQGKPTSLATSIEKVPELQEYLKTESTYGEVLRWAQKIENLVSNVGVHASGIVISNEPMNDKVPLYRSKDGTISTQWEMNAIEEVGYIKFDFLGLDALTKIQICLDLVKERHGTVPDLDNIPLDDEEVYARLKSGDTVGVFQLEGSSGMRDMLVRLSPNNLEDIIALVAIYRPGPMGTPEVNNYLAVRAGQAEPRYLVPEMKPILKATQGLIIYQEQVMRISTDLCGYSKAEADDLRKAVGKKKADLMAKHETKFKSGWINNGLPKEAVDILWAQIVQFAAYAFNRSHSAAYAMVTYQTAWLKTHYPVEYMTAIMISQSGKRDDVIKCISECKRMGIKVLPPDINTSKAAFSIVGDKEIRFGLGPIKNLGESPVEGIITDRSRGGKYVSIRDFCERIDLGTVNRLKLESLVKAGAFDSFDISRAGLSDSIKKIWDYREDRKRYESKKETFDKKTIAYEERMNDPNITAKKKEKYVKPVMPEMPVWPELLNLDEFPRQEIALAEHELLGFYVSCHPLDGIPRGSSYTVELAGQMPNKAKVTLIAVINNINEITTKASKKKMAFIQIEDLTGTIEGVVFSTVYDKFKDIIVEGVPLKIQGTMDVTESDDSKISKIRIQSIEQVQVNQSIKSELLSVDVPVSRLSEFVELLQRYSGELHQVKLSVISRDGTNFRIPQTFKIGEYKNIILERAIEFQNEF